jgi:hypothetical protein
MHSVEQGKINMFNTYFGVQVMGKPFGYLPGNPVLAKWGLDENIHCCNKEQQREEKPQQYFFKSLQAQLFVL